MDFFDMGDKRKLLFVLIEHLSYTFTNMYEMTQSNVPCNCGDHCQCSTRDEPTVPVPAIPSNQSGHEQVQLMLLAVWSNGCCDIVPVRHDSPSPESALAHSLTAQQTCALLSRFTT